MSEDLIIEREDEVMVITLNRPESLNALTRPLHLELNDALADAARAPDIGCVVLTGAGRGFCAGGDIRVGARDPAAGAKPSPASALESRIDMLRKHNLASRLLHEMPKPTIAMVNGPCAGAGLSLAGACDFRFAGASALFTSAFIKVGLSGDNGGAWFWTRILGTAKARRLFMLSERFEARAALEFGLVHEVWPDEELRTRTMQIANQLSRGGAAMRYCKEVLNAAEDGAMEQVMALESLAQALSGASRTRGGKSGG